MQGKIVGTAVLALMLLWATGSRAQTVQLEWERDNARLARQFVHIATTTEYGNSSNYVNKWLKPLVVKINGKVDARIMGKIRSHLQQLNTLGVTIRLLQPGENSGNANVIANFVNRAVFEQELRREKNINDLPSCYGTTENIINGPNRGEIVAAKIVIPNDLNKSVTNECIEEEFTQVLGLINDSYELQDSLFNDENTYDRISESDRLFVRLLYMDEVKIGYDQKDLYAIALKSLNRLRPRYYSNGSYDSALQSRIQSWEQLLREGHSRLQHKGSHSIFKRQLALAKNIESHGAIEATAHSNMVTFLLNQNMYEQAFDHARAAYNIYQRILRPHSLRMADAIFKLGSTMILTNRREAGEKLLRQAKSIINNYWPDNTEILNRITISEASSLFNRGNYQQLQTLVKPVLAGMAPKDNILLLNGWYILGLSELAVHNYSAAGEAYQAMLTAYQTILHPHRQSALSLLQSFQLQYQRNRGQPITAFNASLAAQQ